MLPTHLTAPTAARGGRAGAHEITAWGGQDLLAGGEGRRGHGVACLVPRTPMLILTPLQGLLSGGPGCRGRETCLCAPNLVTEIQEMHPKPHVAASCTLWCPVTCSTPLGAGMELPPGYLTSVCLNHLSGDFPR